MAETNYVSNYQQYLNSKGSETSDDPKVQSTDATKSKSIRRKLPLNCKLCKLLYRREDMAKILNQGLYNKYTSSLDYYYTKDINAVIMKKKKPFTIKFKDDQIFYEDQEYLKKFNRRKDSKVHMIDIKTFYSKFKDYPKFFDAKLFGIMNAAIRKHRRLEYLRVFRGNRAEEKDPPLPNEEQFNFVEQLGESFKQNYASKDGMARQMSKNSLQTPRGQTPREQKSLIEIKKCFKELVQYNDFEQTDHKFSSDYYQYHTTGQNYFELYSRTDSLSAINDLGDIIEEFSASQKQQQQFKPMIKSEILGHKKSYSTISESAISGENKQGVVVMSVRNLSDPKEAADKKIAVEETRALTSKTNSQANFNNPSQEMLNFNTATARIKHYGTLSSNRNIPGTLSNKNQNVNDVVEDIRQQPKTTVRNNSIEKYENTHRDTQRQEIQQNQVSSHNYRYQLGGDMATIAGQSSSARYNMNELGNYPTGEQKKKLLLDAKDFQVDKNNLYKNINQKWRTTNGKDQIASNSKLFTPIIDNSNTITNKEYQKEGLPSGNRYILTKRTLANKLTPYEHSSVVLGGSTNGHSPNQISKYYKNASQGKIEKQTTIMSSKITLDKQAIQDDLLQESVRNRISEIESLSRGSKAYMSSKKLLEKVFAKDNTNQMLMAPLVKSPSKNARQIKISNKEDLAAPITAKNSANNINSSEYEKLPSPHRHKVSNIGNKPEFFQGNGSSSQATFTKLNPGKLDIETHYQPSKNVILSPKIIMTSPTGKLQPYREPLGARAKKRNFSTENGNEQYLSPKVSNGMIGQVHARQKSSDVMYNGAQTHK